MTKKELSQKIKKQLVVYKEAGNKLNELRELEIEMITMPTLKKNIGKCFKFKNSYGGSDSWWLYIKIIGLNGICYVTENFEIDINNAISINTKIRPDFISREYMSIPDEEYEKERNNILKKLDEHILVKYEE